MTSKNCMLFFRSAPGDKSLVELYQVSPGGPVQHPGDGQAGQLLDRADICVGFAIIAAIHLAGLEVGHNFVQRDKHGLHDEHRFTFVTLGRSKGKRGDSG